MSPVMPSDSESRQPPSLAANARWAEAGERVDFPSEVVAGSIPARLEHIVKRYAERTAIEDETQSLTYAELNRIVNRLAHAITAAIGEQNEPVAFLLTHGVGSVVAMLGILKANKAYVGLDRANPTVRLQAFLDDAQARLIISDDANLTLANALAGAGDPDRAMRIINIERLDDDLPDANPQHDIGPDTPAGIYYTSGSTGQPKGVFYTHRIALHFTLTGTSCDRVSAADRQPLLLSCSFAWSLVCIMSSLLNGATLCMTDVKARGVASLADWLITRRITLLPIIPSLFRQLVGTLRSPDPQRFPDVRYVLLGGETCTPHDIELWQQHFAPDCVLAHVLASTEALRIAIHYFDKQSPLPHNIVQVGYAVLDKELLIWDEHGQPVEDGETGELAIRSRFLAPGYWRKAELTRAVFLRDPEGHDCRIYTSGDQARRNEQGALEFLGRKDFQVKIRGHRVQISEVETALMTLPTLAEAAVVAVSDRRSQQRLVAHVVVKSQPAPTVRELRAKLRATLPDYMLPAVIMFHAALPRNQNGKVDRRALPTVDDQRPALDVAFVAPRDDREQRLAAIWESILQVAPIGVHDNFFEMGGDSLNAVALFVEIEKIFGKPLPLYTLLGAPTVERLARALAEQHSESAAGPLVPIQPHGSKYPFFFVPGGTGEAVGFAKLIPFLGEDQPFLAFEPREDEGLQSYRSMTSITANYVRAMRQVQPAGPYLLGGACIGGKVALAMAQQLKREGETVGALIMLDSRPSYDPERASVGNRIVESMKALLPYRLRFMLGRVRPKLIHLRTLSWSERLPYILKKRRGWQGILAQSRSDYVRAVVGFMPPPYAGDVHMLASAESYRTDPTLGWRDIICGQLAVQIVPGDHSNYLTQHLDDAGRTLSRWLNEAQGPERRVSAP